MVQDRAQQDEGILVALRRGVWIVCLLLAALAISLMAAVQKQAASDLSFATILQMECDRLALQQVLYSNCACARCCFALLLLPSTKHGYGVFIRWFKQWCVRILVLPVTGQFGEITLTQR